MIIDVLYNILQNLEPPSELALAFISFFLDGFDMDFKASFIVFGGFSVVWGTALGLSVSS